ncbi:formate/nitrite transporter family protein [Clostridium sp. UBA4548]|uniref:formate/nitrite transporter family protein n=1 Tax=Clostridium sp. UBA4548 TaxID=1946361 RepID=UPI0025B8F530|nr:formate/nitrite transporter family protein [Clostridium sp. UBA4548]
MDKKMLTPAEITDYVEEVGIKKANNKTMQTLLLAILAGAFIAMGAYGASMASHSVTNVGLQKTVAGLVFPVGLLFVLICGAELFTGNALLSIALAEKKITVGQVIKNWTLVFVGNFIGSIIIAVLIFNAGLLSTGTLGGYAIKVAATKASLSFGQALSSGILCNIIVCFCVWGSYAAKDVSGKVLMGFIPIFVFVISGYEHVVANMYYFTIGLLAKTNEAFVELSHVTPEKLSHLTVGGIFNNIIPVTIGNIIGGAVFVGLTYWAIYKYIPSKKEVKSQEKMSA